MNTLAPSSQPPLSSPVPADIDTSCRVPLLVLLLSAAIWLVFSSVLALIASIKFHAPGFLAGAPWLTYGRIQPAALNAFVYGFCLQGGLGVGLWLLARLGRVLLVGPLVVLTGAILWNLAVTLGVAGILQGGSTGFDLLEMTPYSVVPLFIGYVLLGVCGVLMFQRRQEHPAFVSQWFLLAALFWFPWIYSTAELLLVNFPVRGVAQSVIAWWYADNLLAVWLGLVGLAAAFYFVPKLLGRDLYSHYLALFTFWILILCGSWAGIPGSAPVPAWMPTVSAVAAVLLALPVLTVALNLHGTLRGRYGALGADPVLGFAALAAVAFVVAGLCKVFGTVFNANQELQFTWFTRAVTQLYLYGFVGFALFGAAYYIVPRLLGTPLVATKLVRLHFWLALAGVVLLFVPLGIGGIREATELNRPDLAFNDVVKGSLAFLRVSTVGELFYLFGSLVFLANLTAQVVKFYHARATAAYTVVTTDLYKRAEAKS